MQKVLIFCFLILSLVAQANDKTKVKFYKGELTAVKETAKAEGKLYVYDFVANWCTPCKWMDETTYNDPTLSQYISENYVFAKVDIDDFDGFALKEKHKVITLPTILVFNQEGKVVGRYEESLSATKLMDILKKHNTTANKASKTSAVAPKPKLPAALSRPPLATGSKVETKTETKPNVSSVTKTTKPTTPNPAKENRVTYSIGQGLFKMDISRRPTKGFSIQMISLGQYDNVVRTYEELKEKHAKQPILMYIENVNGKTNYKILVGEFKTKEDAEEYKKSKAPDGFIKDLAKMK